MYEDLDSETQSAIQQHIKKLENLAITERKITERGKDAVRSLAIMAYLVGHFDQPPPRGESPDSAEIVDLSVFRKAA
jgi:hypothetical protein